VIGVFSVKKRKEITVTEELSAKNEGDICLKDTSK
jgi:hypothetical protein